jgi:hypothetical protein
MRIVALPFARPMRCAAIPYIGQSAQGEIWFDTGSEMMGPDDHVYLSGTAVKECARMIGWVPQSDIRAVRAELDATRAQLVEARQELAGLQRQFDAIDVLASRGFVERKKPGRPPKEVVS